MQHGHWRSSLAGWGIALTALLVSASVISRAQVSQQTLLQETFRGPDSSSSVLTLNVNAAGFPCLTADPSASTGSSTIPNCNLSTPDPPGSGTLRFTSTAEQHASGFVAETSLPTSQGLEISFTQYQYGGYGLGGPGSPGGADGISFFMAVAPPPPSVLGPQGGALGYASAGSAPGLPGAWLGVGLDAFGNFSNPGFGSPSCPVKSWAGFNPDSITVRGPGNGLDGYCLLASSADPIASASNGWPGLSTVVYAAGLPTSLRGASRAASARHITIQLTPNDGLFRVLIDDGSGPTLATSGALPTFYYDPQSGALINGLPPRVTFGFAASTGSATDIHEISDLVATTASGAVPVLALTKTASAGSSVSPGQAFSYTLTPRIGGTTPEALPLTLRVSDDIPAGLALSGTPAGTSWQCTTSSASSFSCAYTKAGTIAAGTTLTTITVPVIVDAGLANGTPLVNTATVLSADAATPVSATASVTVTTVPPLAITTTTLPGGTVGTAYSASLAATGGTGTRSWTLASGTLPAGLTLSTAGAISGTPTASGTVTFTVRVTDAAGATTTRSLSIAVAPATVPLVITTTTLPNGIVGTAYSTALAATGGTGSRTWSLASGALPAGLTLSTAGAISGTPTASVVASFTVRVTDAQGATTTRALSIAVNPAVTPLSVTTTSLVIGEVGVGYTQTLAATGGTTPYAWTMATGGLPIGLTLSRSGAIAGVPQVAGTVSFTVRVTDAQGRVATRNLNIAVRGRLQITTTGLPNGQLAVAYRAVLQSTGGIAPVAWTVASGALPTAFQLSSGGVLAGTSTAPGVYSFTVRATDALGVVDTQVLRLTIARPQKAYIPERAACTTSGAVTVCAGHVTVVDTTNGATKSISISADAYSGSYIRWIEASPDGSRVFVAEQTLQQMKLREIDTTTDTVVWSSSTGAIYHDLAFSPDSSTLYYAKYVTGMTTYALVALDVRTHVERTVKPNFEVPGELHVSPDGTRIYVIEPLSSPGENLIVRPSYIEVFDTTTGALVWRRYVGAYFMTGGALTPNGNELMVAVRPFPGGGQWSLLGIDTATNTVADWIPSGASYFASMVFASNTRLWAALGNSPVVEDYSLTTNGLVRRYTFSGATTVSVFDNPTQSGGYAFGSLAGQPAKAGLWRFDTTGAIVQVATGLPFANASRDGLAIARGLN